MATETTAFIITAQTNIHPGSGDSNFGIIDNLVQREPLHRLPCINASSLKGALKEYFRSVLESGRTDEIFGPDELKQKESKRGKGSHTFFDARLLTIPVRSNHQLFFNATCPAVLEDLIGTLNLLHYPKAAVVEALLQPLADLEPQNLSPWINVTDASGAGEIWLEDLKAKPITMGKEYETVLGSRIALFSDDAFSDLCDNTNLPVIPRNHLENGESKNLWYEQVLPRQTQFYTAVQSTKELEGISPIVKDGMKPVQIGANATVGYGYTTFRKIIS